MIEKGGFIYIMMSISGVLYIGVTSDLLSRCWEHKKHIYKGFTQKYQCNKLVYYECFEDIDSAIQREKQLKNWKREWKIKLIEANNPRFTGLYGEIMEGKYRQFEKGKAMYRS